jgi:hypothetical protein
VSFAAITLCCVPFQRVFVVVNFVNDSVRKLLDTPSYYGTRLYSEQTGRSRSLQFNMADNGPHCSHRYTGISIGSHILLERGYSGNEVMREGGGSVIVVLFNREPHGRTHPSLPTLQNVSSLPPPLFFFCHPFH